MILLGDKRTKALKVLRRIIVKPHRIELRIVDYRVSSYLMSLDNDSILVSEFEPKMYNNLLEHFSEFTMYLSELIGFERLDHTFKTELIEETTFKGTKAYRLSVPELIETKSSPYVVKPQLSDNVAIRFRLKEMPQFRRVEEITEDKLIITGSYSHFKAEFGKEITGMELKLPFERVLFTAVFNPLGNDKYCFQEHMNDTEVRSLLFRYAEMDFADRNNLSHFDVHKKSEGDQDGKGQGRDRKLVLLVDDKPVVTEIVRQMLETKTSYDVIVTNDSTKTMELVIEHEPDAILLDQKMPEMSGLEVAQLLKERRITSQIPIIFMTAFNDMKMFNEAAEIGIAGYLLKPIDSKKLIAMLDKVMKSAPKKSINLANSAIYVCSDDEGFSRELQTSLHDREIEARCFRNMEDMIRDRIDTPVSTIIIRMMGHGGMSLSIVNTTRRRESLKNAHIVVYPQTESEQKLLAALKDDRLITLNHSISAGKLGANLEKYLGVTS